MNTAERTTEPVHHVPLEALAAEAEALMGAGRNSEAIMLLSVAQQRAPRDVSLLMQSSRAFIAQGRNESAIGALLAALELEPANARLHYALAILLLNARQPQQALDHGIQAFQQAPTAPHATTLSAVLIDLGCYEPALGFSDHALALAPEDWEALNNRALALLGLGRIEDALAAARGALDAAPEQPSAHHNLACILLAMGALTAEAWAHFEWRLRLDGNLPWVSELAARRWNGEDIAGRTILLHAEQGFGDTIQFIRYVPLVAERAGRVVVAVQPALLRLLRDLPGVDAITPIGSALPAFDVVCPLLSLPRIFGTTVETIPPVLPLRGRSVVPAMSDRLLVGLVWRGSRTFRNDRQRSLRAEDLAGLRGIPGVALVSLQKHDGEETLGAAVLEVADPMHGVEDFLDTAAIIAGLDLVIAVDTAVAHLAATMGKPVWLLSRWRGCWRWMLGRADSPWYPGMRVLRQSEADAWDDVLAAVRSGLIELVRHRQHG